MVKFIGLGETMFIKTLNKYVKYYFNICNI